MPLDGVTLLQSRTVQDNVWSLPTWQNHRLSACQQAAIRRVGRWPVPVPSQDLPVTPLHPLYQPYLGSLFSERRFSVEMNILLVCVRKGAFSVASRGNNGCGVKPSRLGLESQLDPLLNLGKSLTYLGLH